MKCACKDCTKRFVGCHATCVDYADFRKEVDTTKKKEVEWKFNERFRTKHKEMMMNKFADRGIDSRRSCR